MCNTKKCSQKSMFNIHILKYFKSIEPERKKLTPHKKKLKFIHSSISYIHTRANRTLLSCLIDVRLLAPNKFNNSLTLCAVHHHHSPTYNIHRPSSWIHSYMYYAVMVVVHHNDWLIFKSIHFNWNTSNIKFYVNVYAWSLRLFGNHDEALLHTFYDIHIIYNYKELQWCCINWAGHVHKFSCWFLVRASPFDLFGAMYLVNLHHYTSNVSHTKKQNLSKEFLNI